MSYQVLARKWRPKKFDEVVGQDHVIKSIQNSIKHNRIGQAYLLTGTRGVGKTTIARLIAKAIRCENLTDDINSCGTCTSCIDFESDSSMNIMEIDGASNNGVDHIRSLISNIQYLPTTGSKKIYIIDEVHMVTQQAFNALLKTLEEPPKHVVFIFATTEPKKVPKTVLSRCQRLDFKFISTDDLISHLNNISQMENLQFENKEIIKKIALQGKGSIRDALSLLDQVLSYTTENYVSEEIMSMALGIAKSSAIKDITSYMLLGDFSQVSLSYRSLIVENVDLKNIYSQIMDNIFKVIELIDSPQEVFSVGLLNEGILEDISLQELIWIYEVLSKDSVWLFNSIDPENMAEILFQKLTLRRNFFSKEDPKKINTEIEEEKKKEVSVPPPPLEPDEPKLEIKKEEKNWDNFLLYLNSISPATMANLEQGNILEKIENKDGALQVILGFSDAEKVFYEYLNESDIKNKIVNHLSSFFDLEEKEVNLQLMLLDSKMKEQTNFQSKVEIRQIKEEDQTIKDQNVFLAHETIKEAEKLFNSKINTIIKK